MSTLRLANLGLVCLFASACTVVLQPVANQPAADQPVASQPAADQPRTTPAATESDSDIGTVDPAPVRRPTVRAPRRLPAEPDPAPGYEEADSPSRRSAARSDRLTLGVPPGHLPGPGECRVWVPGTPPGLQARARSCNGILATAPVGSWILYRPAQYQRQVRVRYLHDTRQIVIAVRAFDAETGVYLHDFALEEDDDNMGPIASGARRPTVRPVGDRNGTRGNSENAPGRTGNSHDQNSSEQTNGSAAGNSANEGRGNSKAAPDSTARVRVSGEVNEPTVPVKRRRVPDGTSQNNEEQPSLDIHARYLPSAGMCRVWVPGLANGRQARPASCEGIADAAPAGAWILRRSIAQPDVIHVDYVDETTPGVIVRISTFDAATGAVLHTARLEPMS